MQKLFAYVGFEYNDGESVLKDVTFTAKQGEVTAGLMNRVLQVNF